MKTLVLLFSCWLPVCLAAQSLYFPPLSGSQWDMLSPAALGWCQEPLDSLVAYAGKVDSKALLILKDGKIVLEQYFGTFTRDSSWYWASAGKTLTATLTGIAQQEGYLSLSDTSSQYLGKGWTATLPHQEDKITVWHQLSMTSGLDDGVEDHYCTLDTCLIYKADAGTRWAYHNGPYTLLDGVIEAATGSTFSAYFNSKIRNKIGMNGFWFKSGYNNVYYSTPRSMARFGLLMLNRGVWNQDSILKDSAYFRQMTTTSQPLNPSYGYLWWLNGKANYMVPGLQFSFTGSWSPSAPADMVAALGKNGQIISVAPGAGIVMVRMGNAGVNTADVSFDIAEGLWAWLSQAMCTPTAAPAADRKQVYPNLARDFVTVSGLTVATTARLTDMLGRVVAEIQVSPDSPQISTAALLPGLYMLGINQQSVVFGKQ